MADFNSTQPASAAPPAVDETTLYGPQLGPFLIGGIFCFLLQGILFIMTSNYYTQYQKDKIENRWFVVIVNVLCFGKVIQTLVTLWDLFITKFSTSVLLLYLNMHIATSLIPLTTAVIGFIVQIWFMFRMYRLLGRTWSRWALISILLATAFCVLLGITGAAVLTRFILVGPGVGATLDQLIAHGIRTKNSITISFSGVMAADVFITGSILIHLSKIKTGFQRTDNVIFRLVRITWQSALPPTICAALNLAFFLSQGNKNSIFQIWSLTLSHLYVISAMYTLNTRKGMQDDGTGSDYVWSSASRKDERSIALRVRSMNREHPVETRVRIQTETKVESDNPNNTSTGDEKGSPVSAHKMEDLTAADGSDFEGPLQERKYELKWHSTPHAV